MQRPYLPFVLVAIVLIGRAVAQLPATNISGTWRLDRDLSTADMSRVSFDRVVVHEVGETVRFDYFNREDPVGSESFVTDGIERPRYETRLERAWASARWDRDELRIRTRSFLDPDGYQSYTAYDTWLVSPDGRTLTDRSSDGKTLVFNRVHPLASK